MQRVILFFLTAVLLLHGLGVFVPEVGFDAVWYHLPVAQHFVELGKIKYWPAYYQSVNPLWSDLLFLVGFALGGELGAKVAAYVLAVSCVGASYLLARRLMNTTWALLAALQISLIQVITWQASSFYVDVAKALWEVVLLLFFVILAQDKTHSRPKYFLISVATGLMLGATLATKLFSLALLPVVFVLQWSATPRIPWRERLMTLAILVGFASLTVLPFALYTTRAVGTPFYSMVIHDQKRAELTGFDTWTSYLWRQTWLLPSSPVEASLFRRDYIGLLPLVFLPLIWRFRRELWHDRSLRIVGLWAGVQWLLWWYLPPSSTRYALSGFIALEIITVWTIQRFIRIVPASKDFIAIALVAGLCFSLAPRLAVAWRNLQFLSGRQTRQEFIQQFYDGHIDQHLKRWHTL